MVGSIAKTEQVCLSIYGKIWSDKVITAGFISFND